eukprot:COSAG02_NODE_614_length_19515_cov_6.651937_5_plen_203_part_00
MEFTWRVFKNSYLFRRRSILRALVDWDKYEFIPRVRLLVHNVENDKKRQQAADEEKKAPPSQYTGAVLLFFVPSCSAAAGWFVLYCPRTGCARTTTSTKQRRAPKPKKERRPVNTLGRFFFFFLLPSCSAAAGWFVLYRTARVQAVLVFFWGSAKRWPWQGRRCSGTGCPTAAGGGAELSLPPCVIQRDGEGHTGGQAETDK